MKKHPGARDFSTQSQAIAGVSSPNCGDKVEVRLLFMAYRPLARRLNCISHIVWLGYREAELLDMDAHLRVYAA